MATNLERYKPELFFWRSRSRHVGGHHELLEVDGAVAILVEDPKDLVDEELGVAQRQDHRVHVQDLVLAKLAIWTVNLDQWGQVSMRAMVRYGC